MPQRKSKKIEEQESTICLRRSPRFLRGNQTGALSPTTPKLAETKRSRRDSFSTPISKIKKTGHGVLDTKGRKDTASNSDKSGNMLRRSARLESRASFSSPNLKKQLTKEKRQTRSSVAGNKSEKSAEGSRRSGRRDGGANFGNSKKIRLSLKEEVIEKRVTRSSVRRHEVIQIDDSDSEDDSKDIDFIVSKKSKSKVGVDRIEKNADKSKKRVTRSSRKTVKKKVSNVSIGSRRKAVVSDEVEPRGHYELSEKDSSEKDVEECGIMKGNGKQNCTRKAQIGEKRKRDGVEEECENAQGWTKEQEFSLQRAYFTAKPTPQFWKKVARMVPGKSAEECFDRIHSNQVTPPQPRTRSRAKIKELSPLSFSASKLLSPAEKKSRKLGSKRRKLLAQKTVRQILQKQQREDQGYNADLFAVLEPTINASPVILEEGTTFASPPPNKASPFLTACRLTSSSSQRKHLSRLNSSQKAAFASPPVLKQIKNKALHEKYIDQLHCRDAKRKAEALRNSRNIKGHIDEEANHLKQNLVKTAKDALVSDVRNAISKFRSLQCIDEDDNSSSRSDDEVDGDDEDDDLL